MQVSRSISIAAGATNSNVLESLGLRQRTIPNDMGTALITLFATGSATGLEHEFFVGSNNPIERSAVNAQNRIPVVPDDVVNTEPIVGFANDQLQLAVTNTTAGALTYFFTLETADPE